MAAAVTVENLSKRYQLGLTHARSLRDLVDRVLHPARSRAADALPAAAGARAQGGEFWALRDVSLEIEQGDVVGFIGANGAGKSTLLKILSRITLPSHGRAVIRGRVAALLEVGTGFHPELTGRENVFLNGTMLGMSKAEVTREFDRIVDFAGVETFIDTPVKRYSSGMTVRLGFAVAAHLQPEVMIVDEVLAVGDASFQEKCMGKMSELGHEGRTILFVSHNMAAIEKLTRKCFVLDGGRVSFEGPSADAVNHYLDKMESSAPTSGDVSRLPRASWSGDRSIEILALTPLATQERDAVRPLLRWRVDVRANRDVDDFTFGITLEARNSEAIGSAFTAALGPLAAGVSRSFELALDDPGVVPGRYHLALATMRLDREVMDVVHDVLHFNITRVDHLPEGLLEWHPGWGRICIAASCAAMASPASNQAS